MNTVNLQYKLIAGRTDPEKWWREKFRPFEVLAASNRTTQTGLISPKGFTYLWVLDSSGPQNENNKLEDFQALQA